jgi:hypothetical protein
MQTYFLKGHVLLYTVVKRSFENVVLLLLSTVGLSLSSHITSRNCLLFTIFLYKHILQNMSPREILKKLFKQFTIVVKGLKITFLRLNLRKTFKSASRNISISRDL